MASCIRGKEVLQVHPSQDPQTRIKIKGTQELRGNRGESMLRKRTFNILDEPGRGDK